MKGTLSSPPGSRRPLQDCRSVERVAKVAKAAGPGVVAVALEAHDVPPGEAMIAAGESKLVVRGSSGRMGGRARQCICGEQRRACDDDSGGGDQQCSSH